MKVLVKQISLICFRAYLEVYVAKNPTCFSRWSFRKNIKQDNFTLYTSENESFMKSWFSEDILDKINIEYKHRNFGISATAIRLAIVEKDFDFVSKHVAKNVLNYLKEREKTK